MALACEFHILLLTCIFRCSNRKLWKLLNTYYFFTQQQTYSFWKLGKLSWLSSKTVPLFGKYLLGDYYSREFIQSRYG